MPINSSGPQPASILIVGEAPGKTEAMMGIPFVGASGQELRRMLAQADIDLKTCRFTNVFMDQPDGNKIENFCVKRAEAGKDYTLPPLSTGNYVAPSRLFELPRLAAEIETTRPSLIVALGNTATWALLRRTGITKLRGNVFPNELVPGGPPVLPTFHPAAILREWSLRTIAVTDLIKVQRFITDGFTVPRRELWLAPTIAEVEDFLLGRILNSPVGLLSVDIETLGGTITCIGFSPDPAVAITVPFYDPTARDRNYWATAAEEKRAWQLCRQVLESPIPKLGQNFLYDLQYLVRFGIRPRNFREDTMIRHHALYPELPKGLGFLGSIYTDEAPWKLLRDRRKEQFKLEDD